MNISNRNNLLPLSFEVWTPIALLLEGSSSYREIKNHPSHLTDEETGLGDKVNTCIPRGKHQECQGKMYIVKVNFTLICSFFDSYTIAKDLA